MELAWDLLNIKSRVDQIKQNYQETCFIFIESSFSFNQGVEN